MKFRNYLVDEEKSATKAALYYMICQILVKGMTFLTTPIFSRILSKSEYGDVNNFISWEGLIFPIVTLNLRASINKSKYDYPDDNDNFFASILLAALIFIGIAALVFEMNSYFFVNVFSMPIGHIRLLFIYLTFMTAFDFQQIQYNIYGKYKKYVIYSIVSIFLNLIVSLILVHSLEDKLIGRLIGIVFPCSIVGTVIFINAFRRGSRPKFKYVKNALSMTLPLLLSALSATIMSTSDRVMIKRFSSSEDTALYSIAYSIAGLGAVIFAALNQAWSPWMLDHLKQEDYALIKKRAKLFSMVYAFLIIGLMLISPELILLMGGKQYYEARYVMPPIILAMVCQFFYAFYFDTEYFYGETYVISLGTLFAAVINLILNFIFIPRFGYIAAAYTTLIGYMLMLIYHFCVVFFKLKKGFVFPTKWFALLIVILSIIQVGIAVIFDLKVIRYIVFALYVAFCCWLGIRFGMFKIIFERIFKSQK